VRDALHERELPATMMITATTNFGPNLIAASTAAAVN
jgi:hypothetical protein